jgi:hypothetical protein
MIYSPNSQCRTVAAIQKHIVKRGKRTGFRKVFHANHDENAIAAWRLEFEKIRRVFGVRSFASF